MPVCPSSSTTRISQDDFKALASEVMRHVFDIHNEFGRLFDQLIYKRELAARLPGVVLEAAVTVSHGSFVKSRSTHATRRPECSLQDHRNR